MSSHPHFTRFPRKCPSFLHFPLTVLIISILWTTITIFISRGRFFAIYTDRKSFLQTAIDNIRPPDLVESTTPSSPCSLKELYHAIQKCDQQDKKKASEFCSKSDPLFLAVSQIHSNLQPLYANKLVLLLGDHPHDHKIVSSICNDLKGTLTIVDQLGRIVAPDNRALDGDARICVVRGANSPDDVFVIASFFHFGVEFKSVNAEGKGWTSLTEGTPSWQSAQNMLKTVPWMLHSVASFAFPELCKAGGVKCPSAKFRIKWSQQEIDEMVRDAVNAGLVKKYQLDKSIPTNEDQDVKKAFESYMKNTTTPSPSASFWYPSPNFILTSSSIWDIKSWMSISKTANDGTKMALEELMARLPAWPQHLLSRLVLPLQHQFPDTPIVLRTLPDSQLSLLSKEFPVEVARGMNKVLRTLGVAREIRLLDWAAGAPKGFYKGLDDVDWFIHKLSSEVSLWMNAINDCKK
ncbi:hypothetical protein HDU76_012838 [Blyttiomyces sp. JEL0837]|nr:hypothetical protein HDU76_012838 [Blyttiomyces sp. JEL0837]